MAITTKSSEKLVQLLSKLPEVQALIDREDAAHRMAAVKARQACRARLMQLRAIEDQAKTEHQSAANALDAARAGLRGLEEKSNQTFQAWSDAQRRRNAAENSYQRDHGESAVTHTLFCLQAIDREFKARLAGLEANRFEKTSAVMPFKRERPEVVKEIGFVSEKLNNLNVAVAAIEALADADMTPGELANQVQQILINAELAKPKTTDAAA